MSDLKDIFSPYLDRIKSPFFGTFIVIWVLYNWELFLKLYNIPFYTNYEEQLSFVRNAINGQNSCRLFWKPMGWTIVSLVTFYTTNAIGLAVKEAYSMHLKPIILYVIGKDAKIVSKDEHQRIKKEHKLLEVKYSELDKSKGSILTNLQAEEQRNELLKKDNDSLEDKVKTLTSTTHGLETDKKSNDENLLFLKNIIEVNEQDKKRLTEDIAAKTKELSSTTKKVDTLNSKLDKYKNFQIQLAIYGVNDKVNPVTDILQKLLTNDTIFQVGNKNFGPDPSESSEKFLTIIYTTSNGESENIIIKEHNFLRKFGSKIFEVKNADIVKELQALVPKEGFTNKLTRQWIHQTNCFVNDFVFNGKRISIDTILTGTKWETQVFSRDDKSLDYLNQIVYNVLLKHGFKTEILPNKRILVGRFEAQDDLGLVVTNLKDVIGLLDSLKV